MTATKSKENSPSPTPSASEGKQEQRRGSNRGGDRRGRRSDRRNQDRDSEWQERVRLLGLSMVLVEGEEKGIDLSDMIEFRWLPQISGKEDFEKFVSNEEDTE